MKHPNIVRWVGVLSMIEETWKILRFIFGWQETNSKVVSRYCLFCSSLNKYSTQQHNIASYVSPDAIAEICFSLSPIMVAWVRFTNRSFFIDNLSDLKTRLNLHKSTSRGRLVVKTAKWNDLPSLNFQLQAEVLCEERSRGKAPKKLPFFNSTSNSFQNHYLLTFITLQTKTWKKLENAFPHPK